MKKVTKPSEATARANINKWRSSITMIVLEAMGVENDEKELKTLEKKANDAYKKCVAYMWERPMEYNNCCIFDIVEFPALRKYSSEIKNRVIKKLRKFNYIIPEEGVEQLKKENFYKKLNAGKIAQEKLSMEVKKMNGELIPDMNEDKKTPTEKKIDERIKKEQAKLEKITRASRYFVFNREGILKAKGENK